MRTPRATERVSLPLRPPCRSVNLPNSHLCSTQERVNSIRWPRALSSFDQKIARASSFLMRRRHSQTEQSGRADHYHENPEKSSEEGEAGCDQKNYAGNA